jgi:hypothetical protein
MTIPLGPDVCLLLLVGASLSKVSHLLHPLRHKLPGDCNLVVLRHHRHSELFEALSLVERKGSRIVALFQVFQQGSEEFPGNYDFAVSSIHFFSFYVYQVGLVDHRECIAECRVCGLPASLYHPKPRRLHSFCLSYAAYARPEKARGRQLVADITIYSTPTSSRGQHLAAKFG